MPDNTDLLKLAMFFNILYFPIVFLLIKKGVAVKSGRDF